MTQTVAVAGLETATRWARAMLEPGAAVIVDTETTDLPGPVCEIAVIDTRGAVLLDTLVDPGVPIQPDAGAVHGITGADVAGAPQWPVVLPRLLQVTEGRTVLAYNADFDADVIAADCARYGLGPAHLADPSNWGCVMERRADWVGEEKWARLNGGHRALGDTRAALGVLRAIAGV